MSWRRLGIILQHLPSESAYVTAARNDTDPAELPEPEPGKFGPWSNGDFLLAAVIDRLGQLVFMQSDGKGKKPDPYPRPGLSSNVRAISPLAAAYLRYLAEHHGEAPPEDWEPEVV